MTLLQSLIQYTQMHSIQCYIFMWEKLRDMDTLKTGKNVLRAVGNI